MHKDRRGYAYATFRDGGSVCRRYIGAGEAIELTLQEEQLAREEKQREGAQREEAHERERQEIEAPIALLDAQTTELLEALLVELGYHRPQRHAWRKRRQNPMSKAITNTLALQERGQSGDLEAARAFWREVDSDPARRAELVKQTGDLAARALNQLVAKITEGDLVKKGGIQRQLDAMRSDLSGPNSSPLERLLIERVCVCWLQLAFFEFQYVAQMETDSLKISDFRQKQVGAAHKRYLASIKTLAQVRKLQLPTVQINMAEKQVNIGQLSGRE
jgi:hypothetical protein